MNTSIHWLLAAILALGSMPLTASAFTYQIDDWAGFGSSIDVQPPKASAWLNSFQVEPGGETLESVYIRLIPGSANFTVKIWSDPNQDGNPSDAIALRSVDVSIPVAASIDVPIAPLTLPVGTWFFAGAYRAPIAGDHTIPAVPLAASIDPAIPNRSFFARWNDSAIANADQLGTADDIASHFISGNLVIRVNAVPEPATVVLVILSLVGFGARRRARP